MHCDASEASDANKASEVTGTCHFDIVAQTPPNRGVPGLKRLAVLQH
jgi:hypothetical protein